MMTIKEFGEIMCRDEALRNEYLLAEKEGSIDRFFREHDVDATARDIEDLYQAHQNCQLDDSELDNVSGGRDYSTCHTSSAVGSSGTDSLFSGSDTCHTASSVRKTSSAQKRKPFLWWLW
jgi:hypothetical protein